MPVAVEQKKFLLFPGPAYKDIKGGYTEFGKGEMLPGFAAIELVRKHRKPLLAAFRADRLRLVNFAEGSMKFKIFFAFGA